MLPEVSQKEKAGAVFGSMGSTSGISTPMTEWRRTTKPLSSGMAWAISSTVSIPRETFALCRAS